MCIRDSTLGHRARGRTPRSSPFSRHWACHCQACADEPATAKAMWRIAVQQRVAGLAWQLCRHELACASQGAL
eukprot:10473109-Alexandrium_andersonii.AAC.1